MSTQEDHQALVDEYARRLSRAQGESVALAVALRKMQKENVELRRLLANMQEGTDE